MQSFILIASCKVYMLSTCLIIVNNLDPLAEEVFVRFLHSKLTLRCPFRIVPFGKESLLRCSLPKEPISRVNELDSIALRKERHLEVFYVGYLSVLPHLLIYLDIHVCYYKLSGIYFICWVIIQCSCICYLPQIIPALITGSSLNGLLGRFNGNSSLSVCGICLTCPYFLAV